MESWQKLLAAAAGATGVAALIYFLLKEEEEAEAEKEAAVEVARPTPTGAPLVAATQGSSGVIGKEELMQILMEMVESQKGTTQKLRGIAKEMSVLADPDFDTIYKMVQKASPADPLEARGITMADLEGPLQSNQNDPMVLTLMQALMSGSSPDDAMPEASAKGKDVSLDKIKDINIFLLKELEIFIKSHKALKDKSKYDVKVVMIMVQATLDSKVMKKFNIESADIQRAIMQHQQKLSKDKAFIEGQMSMQSKMENFMKALHA